MENKQKPKVVSLYGHATEDAIDIGLTDLYDICDTDDEDCDVIVVGHKAYASSLEQAERFIRAEYVARMKEAGTLSHAYLQLIS